MYFSDYIKKGTIGFSYGISFPLTVVLLDYWLKESGVSNSIIGMFSLFHLPFALKLFFAPIIDDCDIPFLSKTLGRKRSWVVFSQSMLIVSVFCMANVNPANSIFTLMFCATLVSMFDGFQNVALYPYQINGVQKDKRGYVAAIVNCGHKAGGIAIKLSVLWIAYFYGWTWGYKFAALAIFICMLCIAFMKEPEDIVLSEKEIHREGVSSEIQENNYLYFDFAFRKLGIQIKKIANHPFGSSIFAILVLFRASDFFLQKMSRAFFVEIGFSKFDIVNIVQFFGSTSVFLGGIISGYLLRKFGVINVMFYSVFAHMLSLFFYLLLYYYGNDADILRAVIFFEGITGGAISTAFIAFLYELCKNGSQYAIMWATPEISGFVFRFFSGIYVDKVGWESFFVLTPLLSIPVLIILYRISMKTREIQPL